MSLLLIDSTISPIVQSASGEIHSQLVNSYLKIKQKQIVVPITQFVI